MSDSAECKRLRNELSDSLNNEVKVMARNLALTVRLADAELSIKFASEYLAAWLDAEDEGMVNVCNVKAALADLNCYLKKYPKEGGEG